MEQRQAFLQTQAAMRLYAPVQALMGLVTGSIFFLFSFFVLALPLRAQAQEPETQGNQKQGTVVSQAPNTPKDSQEAPNILDADFGSRPTYIKADSLTLFSESQKFEYRGNVEVQQGDFLLTCAILEGRYNEKNELTDLFAHTNVVITKGEGIRATSEKAHYEAKTETVNLSESPELLQEKNILTADFIRIFLQEDRSTAEGNVRVKMIDETQGKDKKKGPAQKDSSLSGRLRS